MRAASAPASADAAPRLPADREAAAAERGALTTAVVSELDSMNGLRTDYEQLQAVTGNGLPFTRHEWHLAWCTHFLQPVSGPAAQPAVYAFYNADGTCVAILPLIRTRRCLGPMTAIALDVLGPDPAITEVRAPLVAPGYEKRVAEGIVRILRAEGCWDWIHWSGISPRFGKALDACAQLHWQDPLVAHVLELPRSWEDLRAGLKRNIRESLRHCGNSLRRDGICPVFRVVREPARMADAIDRFLVLHALRARRAGGNAHRNFFAGARTRAFLRDATARLAQADAVRVFELLIDGEVVASRIGFVTGTSLFLYYSGYDPRWGKYSVMTTTVAEALKYAIGEGLVTVNLSTGTDLSKTRWSPRRLEYGSAYQVAESFKSRLAYAIYRRARSTGGLPRWLSLLVGRYRRNWI